MIAEERTARFMALFAGREDAYGTGEGRAVRAKPTSAQFDRHLAGAHSGLGIYPLRPDNTVRFAAIDLDEPDFEFIRSLQPMIPGTTWVERSRSGNAHLWVFFERDCPAWVARGILKAVLESMGRPHVEVFPKQDRLREGMLGNYINLPFHGTERPILFGDAPVELDPWLGAAWVERADPDAWERRALALGIVPPERRPELSKFGERETLHECAMHIYENRESNPIAPGHRHDVYLALSKQLLNWRAITPETARRMVHEVNQAALEPAPDHEVDRIVDTVLQAGYTSTGCDGPLVQPYVRPDCPIANA